MFGHQPLDCHYHLLALPPSSSFLSSFIVSSVVKDPESITFFLGIRNCKGQRRSSTRALVSPPVCLRSKLIFFDSPSLLCCAHDSLKCWWQLAHDSWLMTACPWQLANDSLPMTADESLPWQMIWQLANEMTADDSLPMTADMIADDSLLMVGELAFDCWWYQHIHDSW